MQWNPDNSKALNLNWRIIQTILLVPAKSYVYEQKKTPVHLFLNKPKEKVQCLASYRNVAIIKLRGKTRGKLDLVTVRSPTTPLVPSSAGLILSHSDFSRNLGFFPYMSWPDGEKIRLF